MAGKFDANPVRCEQHRENSRNNDNGLERPERFKTRQLTMSTNKGKTDETKAGCGRKSEGFDGKAAVQAHP